MIDTDHDEPGGAESITVSTRQDGRAIIVAVAGVIDMTSAPTLSTHIDRALAGRPAALVIDLSGVDFMASSGLEALVYADRNAHKRTVVAVVASEPATAKLITRTGIDKAIAIYQTVEEALSALPH